MAGGTGGHLFPAMALAQELRRRGHEIHLVTDERVTHYGAEFPASGIHVVPAATPSIRHPVKFAKAAFVILGGVGRARKVLRMINPDAVVGFGGYPCFPPFLAAAIMGVPGVLHEQNAVLGRANRALARAARVLAMSFADTAYADKFALRKVLVGNPVRDRVRAVAGTAYPALSSEGPIKLLVFGGSQGARAFSDIVPAAIASMGEKLRKRFEVTQQCREEDLDRVAEIYRAARVNVELATFFSDLPERIAASHLVIGRAGASTVAELGVLGRPAILVPLPGSLDQDQRANALVMEKAGGAWVAEQATLSPQSLATELTALFNAPDRLAAAANAARSVGVPDAVERLADLAEQTAKGQS